MRVYQHNLNSGCYLTYISRHQSLKEREGQGSPTLEITPSLYCSVHTGKHTSDVQHLRHSFSPCRAGCCSPTLSVICATFILPVDDVVLTPSDDLHCIPAIHVVVNVSQLCMVTMYICAPVNPDILFRNPLK
jgi:hypothetical protein